MSRRVEETATALLELADDARAQFGALTVDELNWRPAPGQWSVAQCFEHLITIQSAYLPTLRHLATGTRTPTLWERISPLSGLFGRLLIRSLDPDNSRKSKAVAKSLPPSSDIDGQVTERFHAHQCDLASHLRALPEDMDPAKVVITSPVAGFVTYSLDDCMTIFVIHGRRHFAQAQRVLAALG